MSLSLEPRHTIAVRVDSHRPTKPHATSFRAGNTGVNAFTDVSREFEAIWLGYRISLPIILPSSRYGIVTRKARTRGRSLKLAYEQIIELRAQENELKKEALRRHLEHFAAGVVAIGVLVASIGLFAADES